MINLFCALACEAKPLIKHYQLQRFSDSQFYEAFIDKNHTVSLTITGTGKVSIAGAVIHSSMLFSCSKYDGWINIGIAGHVTLAPGTPVLANKIIDAASSCVWYPQIVFNTDIILDKVISIDKPSSDYPEQGILDMEASGFYEAASKTGVTELSHCLKIISDNKESHYKRINSKSVSNLVYTNIEIINGLIVDVRSLSDTLQPHDPMQSIYQDIITTWHFTQNQRIQLDKTLKRWNVLLPHQKVIPKNYNKFSTSSQFLTYLSKKLNAVTFHYP